MIPFLRKQFIKCLSGMSADIATCAKMSPILRVPVATSSGLLYCYLPK